MRILVTGAAGFIDFNISSVNISLYTFTKKKSTSKLTLKYKWCFINRNRFEKNHPIPIRKIYTNVLYRFSTNRLTNMVDFISPITATKILHYKKTGKVLDLNNPILFNNKLQWLKLYENNNLGHVFNWISHK